MKCNYCGADNKENAKFCSSCGSELKENKKQEEIKVEKIEVKEVKAPVKTTTTNTVRDGKATASLVLGICSLVIWCLTFPLSIIGLILGIASRERSGKRTAGIVLNGIGLFFSTICIIIMFLFGTIVNAAIEEVSRSGDFNDFFETIEEEIEKAEEESNSKALTPAKPSSPVLTDSSKVIGDDTFGYVKVPTEWVEFQDIDNPSVYQYTDIGEKGYIVTLNTYEEDIAAYQAATNLKNNIESEGNEATITTAVIDKYVAWKVDAKYTDGTYIDIYLFKASDGKLHFVSIEGPDDTNDNFKIPYTFSMSK